MVLKRGGLSFRKKAGRVEVTPGKTAHKKEETEQEEWDGSHGGGRAVSGN